MQPGARVEQGHCSCLTQKTLLFRTSAGEIGRAAFHLGGQVAAMMTAAIILGPAFMRDGARSSDPAVSIIMVPRNRHMSFARVINERTA